MEAIKKKGEGCFGGLFGFGMEKKIGKNVASLSELLQDFQLAAFVEVSGY